MGKKKKKQKGYGPIDDELSIETTIIQSAHLLDAAAVRAIQSNDTKTILEVANHWANLGALMNALLTEADDEEEKKGHDHEHDDGASSVLGFGNTEARERAEAIARARKNRS